MPGMSNPKKRKQSAVSTKKKPATKRHKSEDDKLIEIPEQFRNVEDQDEEFFAGDEVGDFSFLKNLDQKALGRRVEKEKAPQQERRKQPLVTKSEDEYSDIGSLEEDLDGAINGNHYAERNWDEEQEYEQTSRLGDSVWRRKESTKLPVRSARGEILPPGESESESEPESESSSDSEESDSEKVKVPREAQAPETLVMKGMGTTEAKEALAKLAEELLESPEEKISNLKSIQGIFNQGNAAVKKLAMVTQLTVFKDIIPGYRIRPVTDSEKTTKISKEVRQLRAFEESLLISYKQYLTALTTVIKSARTDTSLKSCSLVAVTAICRLLVTVPHFNFRTELLQIIIHQLTRRTEDESFRKCQEAITTLFKEDEEGRASLEAVTVIAKTAKKRHYKIHPFMIQSLLHLRLLTELDLKRSMVSTEGPRIKKKDRIFRTKKQRKDLKELKKVQKDLEEGEAQVSAEEREHLQSETLKIVFSLYFRVLKETSENTMLSVTLDGIAKFARLINEDFFGDLLEVMRELLEGWDEDNAAVGSQEGRVREELVCLNTVFVLLANQGGLNIDLTYFIQRFNDIIPLIPFTSQQFSKPSLDEKSLMELAARIIDAILFTAPTAPQRARLLQFYKRILSNTLHMEEKEALIFTKVLQRMKGRFDKKLEGIWDGEGVGMGLGNLEMGRGVQGWEVALLDRHYCPSVGQAVTALRREENHTA